MVTLKKQDEIRRPELEGTRWVSRFFVMFLVSSAAPVSRLAVKASRKLGGAVVRNHARRRIKELCRQCFPGLKSPVDILVIPRLMAVTGSFDELRNEFEKPFRSRGLLGAPAGREAEGQSR